jgi:hypothetical protein
VTCLSEAQRYFDFKVSLAAAAPFLNLALWVQWAVWHAYQGLEVDTASLSVLNPSDP